MNRSIALFFFATAVAWSAASNQSFAITTVAGINFDDQAFADVVLGTTGSPTFERIVGPTAFDRVPTTAADALLGSDLASMTIELTSAQSVSVGFTDNLIVNGPGADLVIFEEFGTPEGGVIHVEIGGVGINHNAVAIGSFPVVGTVMNDINRIDVDLTAYGFAPGQTTNFVRAFGAGSEFAVFAALNSVRVPEPTAIALAAFGLVGLVGCRPRGSRA